MGGGGRAFQRQSPPTSGADWRILIQKRTEIPTPALPGRLGLFTRKCRQSINPNLSEAAVEEMLIQHLLTEAHLPAPFFDNPDFTRRNVIANEIEKVIDALTSQSFSRDDFSS